MDKTYKAMTNRETSQSSKRIQYITALNARTASLDPTRVRECKKAIWISYEAASIVRQIATVVTTRNAKAIGLQSIGLRHLIKLADFNDPAFYWGPYFSDVGRAIASGEQRYLQERIQAQIGPESQCISRSSPDFSVIVRHVELLAENGFSPDILLAPIEAFADFVKDSKVQIDWDSGRPEQLVLRTARLKVFWSHIYAPLDSFIIFNSQAGFWHAMRDPNIHGSITIALGESEEHPDFVEYWVETLAEYRIMEPQAFAIINLSGKPKESKR